MEYITTNCEFTNGSTRRSISSQSTQLAQLMEYGMIEIFHAICLNMFIPY